MATHNLCEMPVWHTSTYLQGLIGMENECDNFQSLVQVLRVACLIRQLSNIKEFAINRSISWTTPIQDCDLISGESEFRTFE